MARERRQQRRESLDAFLFNVEKFMGSTSVRRMSCSEVGVYVLMMCQQWRKGSLPDDVEAVAEAIAVTESQAADIRAAWPVVRRKFVAREDDPTWIVNLALEDTRRKLRTTMRDRRAAARTAGKASAAKRKPLQDLSINDSSTTVEQPSTNKEKEGKEGKVIERNQGNGSTGEPTARSKRPIFSGQRLVVFEWMLDDLMRLLGPHTDGFDLHEWFFSLDADLVRRNLIPPKRDGGDWLQAALLAEARSRGVPLQIAAAPKLGKQTTQLAGALANIRATGT